jgi:hypothetical protein
MTSFLGLTRTEVFSAEHVAVAEKGPVKPPARQGRVIWRLVGQTWQVPPAESGSIDFGPLVGIWYFVVGILMLRALKWSTLASEYI